VRRADVLRRKRTAGGGRRSEHGESASWVTPNPRHNRCTNGRMTEHCCETLVEAVDREVILHGPPQQMAGRILNEVDSDYAVRSADERPSLYLLNYCPFCGRAISRSVWNAEKKK
jgi:hypothetical protein